MMNVKVNELKRVDMTTVCEANCGSLLYSWAMMEVLTAVGIAVEMNSACASVPSSWRIFKTIKATAGVNINRINKLTYIKTLRKFGIYSAI